MASTEMEGVVVVILALSNFVEMIWWWFWTFAQSYKISLYSQSLVIVGVSRLNSLASEYST
jgi:hypothetical protein